MHPVISALKQAFAESGRHLAYDSIFERAQQILDTAGAVHFDEFWKLYPNKASKDAARRAWVRMEGDTYWAEIRKNIGWRISSKEWEPADPERKRFIPHAATYLNQRRWLDPMTVERRGYGDV